MQYNRNLWKNPLDVLFSRKLFNGASCVNVNKENRGFFRCTSVAVLIDFWKRFPLYKDKYTERSKLPVPDLSRPSLKVLISSYKPIAQLSLLFKIFTRPSNVAVSYVCSASYTFGIESRISSNYCMQAVLFVPLSPTTIVYNIVGSECIIVSFPLSGFLYTYTDFACWDK